MADAEIKINVTSNAKQAQGDIGGLAGSADSAGSSFGSFGLSAQDVGKKLVELGVKSVLAFEDLGLTVGKFSDATGVTTEDASRLIEVAGDLGIGTDTLQGAIIKMEKGLGAAGTGLEKYGVAAVKAKDGTTDVNATFASAIGVINGIQDPLKRSEAQMAIFGKGFAGNAELTTMSADKLKAALAGVSDAKVFDDKKVQQSRDLRDAFDDVKDAGEDILLVIGSKLAPVVTKIAHLFADLVESLGPAIDMLGDGMASAVSLLGPLLEGLITIVGGLVKGLAWLVDGVTKLDDEVMKQVESGKALAETLTDLEARGHAMGLTTEEMAKTFHASGDTTDALEAQIAALEKTIGGNTVTLEDAATTAAMYGERVKGLEQRHDTLQQAISETDRETRKASEATRAMDEASAHATAAIQDQTKAEYDLMAAQDALHERALAAIDDNYALEAANRAATQAAIDATAAVNDNATSEIARKDAIEGARAAAESAAVKYAEVNAKNAEGKDKIQLMIDSLAMQAAALGPGSPVAAALNAYILQLAQAGSLLTKIGSTTVGTTGPVIGAKYGGGQLGLTALDGSRDSYGAIADTPTGGITNYITINTGADPREVIAIIKQYTASGGQL